MISMMVRREDKIDFPKLAQIDRRRRHSLMRRRAAPILVRERV